MRSARNRRGTATVEMALVAPFLLLMLAGTSDIVNYHRTHLRIETASALIAQIVSQCTRITAPRATGAPDGDTEQLFVFGQAAVGALADLRSGTGSGSIIISSLGQVSNVTRVRWQVRTGNTTQPSSVGATGAVATLSGNMSVPVGQTLFVVEVYGTTQTYVLSRGFMGSLFGPLRGVTAYLSRASDPTSLQTAPATTGVRDCTA